MCVQCSHFHRQEPPRHNDAGDPSSERCNLLGEKRPVIWPKLASSTLLQGSFTCRKSTTWDRRLYVPSERSRAEDFFALKNPTASAGFEPANLGIKGQHATRRPPKPLYNSLHICFNTENDPRVYANLGRISVYCLHAPCCY
jgi:hypothetical protein